MLEKLYRYNHESLLWICALLYLISLTQPVVLDSETNNGDIVGLLTLLFGWSALMGTVQPFWAGLSWLANFVFWSSLSDPERGRFYSVLSLIFGSLFFSVEHVARDESGTLHDVTPYLGFYLWWGALLFRLLATTKSPEPPEAGE